MECGIINYLKNLLIGYDALLGWFILGIGYNNLMNTFNVIKSKNRAHRAYTYTDIAQRLLSLYPVGSLRPVNNGVRDFP